MKRYLIHFLSIITFSFLFQSLSAKVWINEFMQSNIDCVRDDLQEFPDSWVELYNDSGQAVNIYNWYISDDKDYKKGWKINLSASIPAKGYILVYCDKVGNGLHASFRLESGKDGNIYLFDSSGNEIDKVTSIPKQPAPNISRGRVSDGASGWAYFVTATPDKQNSGTTSTQILPPPVFSSPGGIFKGNVQLSLSLPKNLPAGVTISNIHYTLDNSEPTVNSPVYSVPVTINQITVVKAKLIHPSYLSEWSQTNTYIISSKNFALPVISISLDDTYLWDDEFGIYTTGNGKYGKTGNGVDYKANWNNDWRRPMNFEYFPFQNKSAVLNQLGEMRISGGWSRANPQKTFIVYGNKRFGVNKRYDYQFFAEKPNQEIKSFMIRNSGNDFWWTHFRDAAIQLFMGGKVDLDYQAYQPAIFYLNGKYWGIQNLRERSSEDFVLANYATEDIDMIENWWGDLKTGDKTTFNQLMNELRKSPNQRNYQWLINQIDINEYINYMILEIYVSNTDFPGNNMAMWRRKGDTGKWRFVVKDTDHGLGIWDTNLPSHNAIQYNTESDGDDRKLFNALLTQDSFRKEFYSRFAIYMGDILHYNSTSQVIDSIRKILEPAMPDHLNRWKDEMWWRDMNSWRGEVDHMKSWCNQRNQYVYQQLKDYFKLGTVMNLKLEMADNLSSTPTIAVNGVVLQKAKLDASYFQKETIQLRFENENYNSYGWEIRETINNVTTSYTLFQREITHTIAENCTDLSIRIINNPTSINSPVFSTIRISAGNNQISVSGLENSSSISVFDLQGRLIKRMDSVLHDSISIPVNQKGIFVVKVINKNQVITEKVII